MRNPEIRDTYELPAVVRSKFKAVNPCTGLVMVSCSSAETLWTFLRELLIRHCAG